MCSRKLTFFKQWNWKLETSKFWEKNNFQIRVKGGSQLNIFPKNNNQIISERIQINKKNKESLLERKTINNKDSNLSRRTIQKIIPSGITKKIKVNKIANLNG